MFDSIFAALDRFLGSKKTLTAFVGVAVDAIAVFGFDVDPQTLTEGLGFVFNTAIAALVTGQFGLDALHGSASDGTVKEVADQLGFADELEDIRGFVSDLKNQLDALVDTATEDDEEGSPSEPARQPFGESGEGGNR